MCLEPIDGKCSGECTDGQDVTKISLQMKPSTRFPGFVHVFAAHAINIFKFKFPFENL